MGEIHCPTDLNRTLTEISALRPFRPFSGPLKVRIKTATPWPTLGVQWTLLRHILEGCWWKGVFPVFVVDLLPEVVPLSSAEVGVFLRSTTDTPSLWPYEQNDYFTRCHTAFLWVRRLGRAWEEKTGADDLWFRLGSEGVWGSACRREAMPLSMDAGSGKGKPLGLTTPRQVKLNGQIIFEVARMASEWKGVDPHQLFETVVKQTLAQGMQEVVTHLPDTVSVIDAVGGREVLSNKTERTQRGRGYHREVSVGSKAIHYHYHLDHLKDFVSKHVQSLKFGHLSRIGQMIVHELNNPIGGIYNLSQVMQMALEDPQKDQSVIDLLQKIEKQCKRAKEIIEHLSSYFGSTPTVATVQESLELTTVFSEVQSLVRAVLRGTELSCSVASEELSIPSHRVKLLHVLVNLVINAAEAIDGQAGGKIQLRAYSESDRYVIDVEDNGPGIPESLMSKIFEPFFSTKGKNTPNSGLGLSLVKFFLDELGYQWVIESSPKRRVTLFRILIPREAGLRHNKPQSQPREVTEP